MEKILPFGEVLGGIPLLESTDYQRNRRAPELNKSILEQRQKWFGRWQAAYDQEDGSL